MTPPLRGIVLIGMRGAGKTTVGSMLAKVLGWTFDDLDDHALRRSGLHSVRTVFAQQGEPAWRTLEAEAMHDLFAGLEARASERAVVAIGGGAPIDPRCSAELQRARTAGWRVAWIRTSLPRLMERLSADTGDRPRLSTAPLEQELASLHAARSPRYESLADLTVDGDALPADVCAVLASALS